MPRHARIVAARVLMHSIPRASGIWKEVGALCRKRVGLRAVTGPEVLIMLERRDPRLELDSIHSHGRFRRVVGREQFALTGGSFREPGGRFFLIKQVDVGVPRGREQLDVIGDQIIRMYPA